MKQCVTEIRQGLEKEVIHLKSQVQKLYGVHFILQKGFFFSPILITFGGIQ